MDPSYHISKNGENLGPYTASELRERLRNGNLTPDDLAWTEGLADWQPLRTVLSASPPPVTASAGNHTKPKRRRVLAVLGVLLVALLIFSVLLMKFVHAQRELDEATEESARITKKNNELIQREIDKTDGKIRKLDGSGAAEPEPSKPKPAASIAPSKPKIAEKKPKRYSLSESFALGDFSYRINSAQKLIRFRGELVDAKLMDGLKKDQSFQLLDAIQQMSGGNAPQLENKESFYLVVSYNIRNDGKTADVVSVTDFIIQDSKGRKFSPSADLTTELAMKSNFETDFLLKELQPGILKETLQAFEIPRDSFDGKLKLIVPEKGLLSSDLAEVSLGL